MKVHVFLAFFTALSIITGVLIYYNVFPMTPIRTYHFYLGVLMVAAPAMVIALMKKRRQLPSAFKTLAFVNSMDIKRKRYPAIISKLILNLFLLFLLKQMLTGLAIKFHVFSTPELVMGVYNLHRFGLLWIPALAVLHPVLMLLSKRVPVSRPAKQAVRTEVPPSA